MVPQAEQEFSLIMQGIEEMKVLSTQIDQIKCNVAPKYTYKEQKMPQYYRYRPNKPQVILPQDPISIRFRQIFGN